MRHFRKALIASAAFGLSVAIGAGATLAQGAGGPIDPGVYTVDNVHPYAPFRGPNIDPATVDVANIATTLDPMSPANLLEVRQRCSVITTNPNRDGTTLVAGVPYSQATVDFCNAVYAWVAANRPDAPVTDAELAAGAQ